MGLMALRGASIEEIIYTVVALLIVVVTSMPIHEFAHAWAAYKLGDDTASLMGRLNLNPLNHLDLAGTAMLLLVGFGWAKPVPVNPNRFTRKVTLRGGMAITAVAGPLANILLALFILTCYKLVWLALILLDLPFGFELQLVMQILSMMISVNIGLAIFNLLPVPPLDGSRIFAFFFPRLDNMMARYQNVLYPILFFVLLATSILDTPIAILRGLVLQGMDFLTGWIDLIARLV